MNFFEKSFFNNVDKVEKKESEITPKHLRLYGEKMVNLFCKKFTVEGEENIKNAKEDNSEGKFIISSSHLNNLDVPAMLKVMGNDFNIQMTGESVLLEKMKYLPHRMMINLAGKDNFTALDYKENSEGKHGSFNPENFKELEGKMSEGKTPWLASHPMSLTGRMRPPSIGPIYLAAKTKAEIIPTALDIDGGSVHLEGATEYAKNIADRSIAVYRIGEAFKLPDIDVSIIEKVLSKRRNGEKTTPEENKEFISIHKQLREQAELLAVKISELLPEEKRRLIET